MAYLVEFLETVLDLGDAFGDFDAETVEGLVDQDLADDLGDDVSQVAHGQLQVRTDAFAHLLDEQLLLGRAGCLVAWWLGQRGLTGRKLPKATM